MTAYAKILEVSGAETIVEEVDFPKPKVASDFKQIKGRPVYRPIILVDVVVNDPLIERRVGPVDTILANRVNRVFSLQALTSDEAFLAREKDTEARRQTTLPSLERELDAIWRIINAVLVRLVESEVPANPQTVVQIEDHIKNLRTRVFNARDNNPLEPDPVDVP